MLVLAMSFGGTVYADSVSVFVSPTSVTKNVGEAFNAVVKVSNSSTKIFAVEGTLAFTNLTCKSITVADGLMPQSAPTCAHPYFLIGIPSGTNVETTLLTVLVSGNTEGSGVVSIMPVDIMGEGSSLSKIAIAGSYTIKSVDAVKNTIDTTKSNSVVSDVKISNSINNTPKNNSITKSTKEITKDNSTTTVSTSSNTATVLNSSIELNGLEKAVVLIAVFMLGIFVGKKVKCKK